MKLLLVLSTIVASASAMACNADMLMNPPESSRAYSSVWEHLSRSMLNSNIGWSAQEATAGQWMQIDLGRNMEVSGLMIQGRADYPQQWVSKIKVQYFTQRLKAAWVPEKNEMETAEFLIPNTSSNSICFDHRFVFARYLRIFVQEWNEWPSMRAGVYVKDDGLPSTKQQRMNNDDDWNE